MIDTKTRWLALALILVVAVVYREFFYVDAPTRPDNSIHEATTLYDHEKG